MNAANQGSRGSKIARKFLGVFGLVVREHRNAFLGVGLVILLIAAAVVAWGKYGPEITRNSRYVLTEKMISVTPPPRWIHADVRAEVVRNKGLTELSLLDKGLVGKVADAFALHPWVARVNSVRKRPDGVTVEVTYRKPVAMVKVRTDGRDGLIPVDAKGILLPTDDFSIAEIRSYLRVEIPDISPYANAGVAWEDQRVLDAAQVAAAWGEHWRDLGLYRIVARVDDSDPFHRHSAFFELHTKLGSQILWGHAPGREIDGEAKSGEKITAVLAHAKQTRLSESDERRFFLDIRSGRVRNVGPPIP